jgi:hypothetical protein
MAEEDHIGERGLIWLEPVFPYGVRWVHKERESLE